VEENEAEWDDCSQGMPPRRESEWVRVGKRVLDDGNMRELSSVMLQALTQMMLEELLWTTGAETSGGTTTGSWAGQQRSTVQWRGTGGKTTISGMA
jgi:hypothetical protein